jgi:hypothetical protein
MRGEMINAFPILIKKYQGKKNLFGGPEVVQTTLEMDLTLETEAKALSGFMWLRMVNFHEHGINFSFIKGQKFSGAIEKLSVSPYLPQD